MNYIPAARGFHREFMKPDKVGCIKESGCIEGEYGV